MVAIIATTIGACAIEKNFIDSRTNGGLDSYFSIELNDLADLMKVPTQARN